MTSLSSRKSWDIFALSIEKIKDELVYELSYLVEKKFWSIFAQQGGPLP
jgi:hypothetical protein